jgi:hypothetical protein
MVISDAEKKILLERLAKAREVKAAKTAAAKKAPVPKKETPQPPAAPVSLSSRAERRRRLRACTTAPPSFSAPAAFEVAPAPGGGGVRCSCVNASVSFARLPRPSSCGAKVA